MIKAASVTKFLQDSRAVLFGIAIALAVFHLAITWRVVESQNQLIISGLLWTGAIYLLWKRREFLHLSSGIVSSLIGTAIVAFVLSKGLTLFWFESSYLRFVPLLIALSLGLIASGFKGLKQYWREFIIVLMLCIPDGALQQSIEKIFNITTLTAKFSTFGLWYTGFTVMRRGADIILPTGSVSVNIQCTGITSAIMLLKVTVPLLFLFPASLFKRVLLVFGAIAIPFLLSMTRVALLAVVVSNRSTFDFWHGPIGNEIFSTMAILVFGGVGNWLLRPADPEDFDPTEDFDPDEEFQES